MFIHFNFSSFIAVNAGARTAGAAAITEKTNTTQARVHTVYAFAHYAGVSVSTLVVFVILIPPHHIQ